MAIVQDYKVVMTIGSIDYEDIVPAETEAEAIDMAIRTFGELLRVHGKVWPVDDLDRCDACGDDLSDGEGYDGLCGNCADRAEPDGEDTSDQEPYPAEQAEDERYPGR